jgi:RHS repeat-associated protein
VRVTFQKNPTTGAAEVIQQDDYYAFGKRKSVGLPGSGAVSQINKYLYNGKDIQDELGQYDYGARFYDPETARWNVVDPLADNFSAWSPYNYVYNSPVNFTDPDGRSPFGGNGGMGFNDWILPKGSFIPVWRDNVTSANDPDLNDGDRYLVSP